ncbi:MAG: hypothetical protein H6922_03515 [Pseudomonadaceae bacterium]|nr:hypothetical protein [Pseudomonadaceae bacterium]
MVDIKVGGPAALREADKKKAAKRPDGAPSFASLLQTDAAEAAAPATGIAPLANPFVSLDEQEIPSPRTGKRQAADLLDNLQQLAEDVLAGQPTDAARKLEAYLQAEVTDRATLSSEAQAALDELSTRVAVAVAKAKP